MPALCFYWHPDARAFAGAAEIARQTVTAMGLIQANPVADALAQVGGTLGSQTAFCISEHPINGLKQLNATQFATLTGGTSGMPKVIARSQASWIQSFCANKILFEYTPADSIAVLGALSHSLALYGVLEGLYLGQDVHALSSLSPSRQCEHLRQNRCSILYATPTQLRLLSANTPLNDLRLILCGGGALSDTVRQHITTLCPNADLHVFYGAAESSFVTLGDGTTPGGSVGHAYPGVEIEVRNPDRAGVGTIWVKSPYLFDGYLQGSSPHTIFEAGWLTVGEQGHLDQQGNLFLRGRSGRTFNIADQSVFLDELETQFAAIKGMPPCVLIPREDKLRGHHLIAVIEATECATTSSALLNHCRAHGLLAPRQVQFLNEFPQLPSGKPDLLRIATLIGASQ